MLWTSSCSYGGTGRRGAWIEVLGFLTNKKKCYEPRPRGLGGAYKLVAFPNMREKMC